MHSYNQKTVSDDLIRKIFTEKLIKALGFETIPHKIPKVSETEQTAYYRITTPNQTLLLHVGAEPILQSFIFLKSNSQYLKIYNNQIFQIKAGGDHCYFFFSEFPKGYKSYVPELQSPSVLEKLAYIMAKHAVALRLNNKTVLIDPETKDIKFLQVEALLPKDEKKLFEAVFIDLIEGLSSIDKNKLQALNRGAKRSFLEQKWQNETLEAAFVILEKNREKISYQKELYQLIDTEDSENRLPEVVFDDAEIIEDEISDKKLATSSPS